MDLNGTLDVSGNSQFSGTITVGVDDTGKDVKFFGATASSYMLWDESADDLNLVASGLGVGAVKDLGAALHVKTADSGASAHANADEIVVEGSGHSGISILSGNASYGRIMFGDDGTSDIGALNYNHDGNQMSFTVNDATTTIFDGANVYIPDTTDDGRVAIFGAYSNPQIHIYGPTTTNTNKMAFTNGNGVVGTIATADSATAYNTSSDYRLKENETAITDGITRIKQLKPYRFNFKADADKTVDGFFAHEVSPIIPEAISGEKDAMYPEVLYTADDELPEGKNIGDVKEATKINPQGIDQAKLVPLLTSALQEAITKIETLEAKVAVLEG